ncbi:hypothetical protein NHH03_02800 [Stieleria sp. TO1_6]|uniref:hypothetical protein n=1 Tax=Stieleria tagensis TaxID=2956795 RepID=UPI00209A69D4|nr:hypothetical protein [Stieleria tagensis]MCO8120652.1 hypothetical protein [Stieleria tagensis]
MSVAAVVRGCYLATAIVLGLGQTALAGMSSENVVVVVNGGSAVSRTLANHYADLRQIPTKNVIVLNQVPEGLVIDLDPFRDQILKPVLAEINARGIASSARVIAYSADFPTAVRIPTHTEKITDEATKKYQGAAASITGLTYFYRYVLSDEPGYLSFGANLYARGKFIRHFINPFSGETKAEFEQANQLLEEQKFAESAVIWQKLQQAHPDMPAIAIRAAEALSQDDQSAKAVEMIRAAIKAGWWSARYLQETPSLQSHLDDPAIAKTMPLLDDSPTIWQGPEAFSASVGWTLSGSRVSLKQGGIPYLLSCTLAVVDPRGSTLSGAVRILQRSSGCDRTFPAGRFAFAGGKGVRATTRFPSVVDAIVYLQEHQFETEIFRGGLPTKAGPIAGLMVGAATVDVYAAPWTMVPGAIADNLTSYGGAFNVAGQTKLTDFLSAGAAMSSGAVAEPYSLPFKFPTPMMYGYYARGLSAIESFYQSIASPYQLLIVGDPLAQPFSRVPDEIVDFQLITEGTKRIRMSRRSLGLKVPKTPTRTIEVSIDDRRFKTTPPVPNIEVNWPPDSSGVFDLRVTLTGLDRTEPRVSFVAEIDVQGDHPAPVAELAQPPQRSETDADDGSNAAPIEIQLRCPGANKIDILHWGTTVATLDGDDGTVTVETKSLGGGPLRFQPLAHFDQTKVRGATLVAR